MKEIFCLFLVIVLMGLSSIAFAANYLVCDPPPANELVTSYQLTMNGQLVDVDPDTTGVYGFKYDLTPLQNGPYTVTAIDRNAWGDSDPSLPFVFTKSGPSIPTGMHIVRD